MDYEFKPLKEVQFSVIHPKIDYGYRELFPEMKRSEPEFLQKLANQRIYAVDMKI